MIAESQHGRRRPQDESSELSAPSLLAGRASLILVPLDGSAEARVAVPVARTAATLFRANVTLVHASDQPLGDDDLMHRMGLRREDTRGTVLMGLVGSPAEAVIGLARKRNAALIVMATHGRSAPSGQLVNPITEEIVEGVDCPVVLIRPGALVGDAEPELSRMLLPLDGAPSSASVISPALDLAQHSRAEVDILYVATASTSMLEEPGAMATPRYVDQPQYEWPTWAREFVSRFGTAVGQHAHPTRTRLFLKRGEPAGEILQFARQNDVDLIVLEWRGRFDPAHNTVVWSVLADAPCPVLLLRSAPKADEE